MGRYTSDDNRSMQLNPENDRYWSSRGYDDDDCSYDCEGSYFGLGPRLSSKQKELGYKYLKELVDSISIDVSDKKLIFMANRWGQPNFSEHPAGSNVNALFENVLKEKVSHKDLTVNFKSFKDFLENNLNFEFLKEQQEELEKNINSLKDRNKISWFNQIKTHHSFKFLDRILEERCFISDDVKRNYIYFNNVYVSDSYMIFQVDPKNQGSMCGSIWDNNYRWIFTCYSSEMGLRPDIVYENFEDIFTCKKYLIDL